MTMDQRVCPDPYPHGSHYAWDGSTQYFCAGSLEPEMWSPRPHAETYRPNGQDTYTRICSECGRPPQPSTGKCPVHFRAQMYRVQDGQVLL